MENIFIALAIFCFGYILNMFYITVLYHRALSHKAILLGPKMMKWLGATGIWVTGLEPKAWSAMHRLHHKHSDKDLDPHSPSNLGLMGVWVGQYRVYKELVNKLITKEDHDLNQLVVDIPFDISALNKRNLSTLPYFVHGLLGIILGYVLNSPIIGVAYFLGIMSHPLQGWMVNALAHRFGGRNFEIDDDSRNNLFVAYFVFGEGLQNNHHAHPLRANFAHKKLELDMGYWMCLVAERFQLLKINR